MNINQTIQNFITINKNEVSNWFKGQYQNLKPVFYSSVDIRDSGYKITPVDTNLFPAGFNNLTPQALKFASIQAKHYFGKAQKILLIPENHSRNSFYQANVAALQAILTQAGNIVEISLLDQNIVRNNNRLVTKKGFDADIILLNTDLTSGIPDLLLNLEQEIIPNPRLGWHKRSKYNDFALYNELVRDFCQVFSLDEFLLTTLYHKCDKVNFKKQTGIECVAIAVEKMIFNLHNKYDKYGIKDQPYVYIKADQGTYGMGIMTAKSGEELYALNKKIRNKMGVIKEGQPNSEVVIQEGVPTRNKIQDKPAEPLIYLINGEVVAHLFRVNAEKDIFNNLNSKGSEIINDSDFAHPNIAPYELIAKLASLAASKE